MMKGCGERKEERRKEEEEERGGDGGWGSARWRLLRESGGGERES